MCLTYVNKRGQYLKCQVSLFCWTKRVTLDQPIASSVYPGLISEVWGSWLVLEQWLLNPNIVSKAKVWEFKSIQGTCTKFENGQGRWAKKLPCTVSDGNQYWFKSSEMSPLPNNGTFKLMCWTFGCWLHIHILLKEKSLWYHIKGNKA